MSRTDHADRLFTRLLDGEPLSADDERHLTTCLACQRAAAAAARLDERLRMAVTPLAAEPMPAGLLDVPPDEAIAPTRSRFAPAMAAAAAVVLAVGVTIGLMQLRPTPTGITSPSPSASESAAPTPSSSSPEPSAESSPIPRVPADPYVVRAGERCADGDAGFTIVVPDGWAANRRNGRQPACRTIGPDMGARGNVSPRIYVSVLESHDPVPEGGEVRSEEQIALPTGVTVTRTVIHVPETGAVVASDSLTYSAALLAIPEGGRGGVLVASADLADSEAVAALDTMIRSLELQPTMAPAPSAMEEVEELYRDRDVCLDAENGWSVIFPDAWWTNTEVDGLDACSYFSPSFFELAESGAVPSEVAVTLSVVHAAHPAREVVATETLTVMARPALRQLVAVGEERFYEYVVELGENDGFGVLIGRTHAESEAEQPLASAVLDALMARVARGDPPPGAVSSEPPIEAPPISAADEAGDFRLELVVEQSRYRAGQPILADATLTYLGAQPSIVVLGSGTGIVGTSLRQLDGDFAQGGASTSDCVGHEILRDRPLHIPFTKSGSYANDDPLIDFTLAYFADPLLRLPPGRWEVLAGASFEVGGEDCGQGEPMGLSVSVEILVEP